LEFKSGKNSLPLFFAECQGLALGKEVVCRVPTRWHSANLDGRRRPLPDAVFCRASKFAECLTLDKKGLCRVSGFAECLTHGKAFFAECISLPSAALGKERPRQRKLHSAKTLFPVVMCLINKACLKVKHFQTGPSFVLPIHQCHE